MHEQSENHLPGCDSHDANNGHQPMVGTHGDRNDKVSTPT
jgi:hypothetical protein